MNERPTSPLLPPIDPSDELSWCDQTAAFLEWQGGDDAVSAGELRAFHALRPTPPGCVHFPDLVYGTGGAGGRALEMLLYARRDPSERRPAVLVFHGGGWRSGTRIAHRRQAHDLASRGFVAGSVTYRMLPEAGWPAALEDAKCAVRFLRAEHGRFGVDPDRIAVAGGSAGAHLAAMVALSPGRWEGDGGHPETSSRVAAAVLNGPPTDLRMPGAVPEVHGAIRDFLGTSDGTTLREASPISHVHPAAPPILSLTGSDDAATPVAPVREFHAALDRCGVPNQIHVYAGRRHAFGLTGVDWFDVQRRTAAFLDVHCRGEAPRNEGGVRSSAAPRPR